MLGGEAWLSALSWFIFVGFFYAVLGDFEDAFAVWEVRAADEPGDAYRSAAGLAEVDACVAGVADDVAADGVDGVSEEDVRF